MKRMPFIVMAFALAAPAPAQNPGAAKSLERLIEDLQDKSFKTREEAAKAIELLGPEALPALRKAKDTANIEVRRRIVAWIPVFESAELVAPKLVTIKAVKQPLDKIIEDIAKQTGYKLTIDKTNALAIAPRTYEFDKLPFWLAVDRICSDTGAQLDGQRGLTLSFNEPTTLPVALHRAFRVTANRFDYRQTSTVTGSRDLANLRKNQVPEDREKEQNLHIDESFQLTLSLCAEPRLKIIGVDQPSLNQATDEVGNSLIVPANSNDRMGMSFRHHKVMRMGWAGSELASYPIQATLAPPKKESRLLRVIAGTIPVRIEKERKSTVVVENVSNSKGKECKLEEGHLIIDEVKENPKSGAIRIEMTQTSSPGKLSALQFNGEFQFQDANGIVCQPNGTSSSSDGTTMHCTFEFSGGVSKPRTLVYIKIDESIYHVPFEFRDLPLP